jgi:hypothetical protein
MTAWDAFVSVISIIIALAGLFVILYSAHDSWRRRHDAKDIDYNKHAGWH